MSEAATRVPPDRRAVPGVLAVTELKVIRGLAEGKTQIEIGSELHLEQSSISKLLKNAEERVGFEVLSVTGRRRELTPAGRELAHAAERVLEGFRGLDDFVRELRLGRVGTVQFATSSTPGSYVLPEIVADFLLAYPRVSVKMRIMPISGLWQVFEAEQFDFAIAPVVGLPKELESERLYDDPVVFFASPRLAIARLENVSLDDLAGETLIGKFVDSHWRRIFRDLEDFGFRAKRRVTIVPPEAVKLMVARELGIGVLFESSIRRELDDGTFVRLRVDTAPLREIFCVVTSPKEPRSPTAEAFLQFLRSRLVHARAE